MSDCAASCCDTSTKRVSTAAARPSSIAAGGCRQAIDEIVGEPGSDEAGGGVEQREVAVRALLAVEHAAGERAFAAASSPLSAAMSAGSSPSATGSTV